MYIRKTVILNKQFHCFGVVEIGKTSGYEQAFSVLYNTMYN
jgi:hypothetical protein